MKFSLSRYYPKGTEYFYSFPAGEESSFFNIVPAWKEELVAARPLICAGPNVKVFTFSVTKKPKISSLIKDFCPPIIKDKNILILPEEISAKVHGTERNNYIKKSLAKLASPGKLIMAQPILDKSLKDLYQIDPQVTIWCNDKKNMPEYIDKQFLPKRFFAFRNGRTFVNNKKAIPVPCVVKVSSSSSGDGVRICRNAEEVLEAKKDFGRIRGSIFIEEFIDSTNNLCVQFGIPHDKSKPVEIIGYNEQLINNDGGFLGAMICVDKKFPFLNKVYKELSENILPKIRQMGWYGVGGIDVLVKEDGSFYFIDSNFRMTATFLYVYLIKNKFINKSVVTFTGVFKGSEDKFRKAMKKLAGNSNAQRIFQVVSISEVDSCYHFNGALFFKDKASIPAVATKILNSGISSNVLNRLIKNKIR